MIKNMYYLIAIFVFILSNNGFSQVNDKKYEAKIDKILSAQFKKKIPGCVALVAKKNQIIYKKAFGMADLEQKIQMQPDMIFEIGSITKQFTAIAILQLMEQGKLSVQDEITKYIPDYPTNGYKITIEHLLTHTSGIKNFTDMKEWDMTMQKKDFKPEEMINFFKNQPMDFEPGTKWNYSNSGYFLLGYIIEKVSGQTYENYINDHIFKVAEMTNSYGGSNQVKNKANGYQKDDEKYVKAQYWSITQSYSAGALMSTVEDLYKWILALNSHKLVKKETLEKAFTSYKLMNGTYTNYGYGWDLGYINGIRTISHDGGIYGYLTYSTYLPDEDIYVAVFSNCDSADPISAGRNIAALVAGKLINYKEIRVSKNDLAKYVGVYNNNNEERYIILNNNLYSKRKGSSPFLLKAYSKNKFYFDKENSTTLDFVADAKGSITGLYFNKIGKAQTFWMKTGDTIPTKKAIQVDQSILDKYIGKYKLYSFNITITKESNHLMVKAIVGGKKELCAESETKFFLKEDDDSQIEFVKDDSGNINKIFLTGGGQNLEARKVK